MAASSELSLTAAKAKFFKVTEDERKLLEKHRLLLRAYIDECIQRGDRDAVYEVPKTLTGPFADYNVYEMGLRLLKQTRAGGFLVSLVCADPFTMRVWGWDDDDWLEENRPKQPSASLKNPGARRITVVPKPGKYSSAQKKPTGRQTFSPEDASTMAHGGLLSTRLKASLEKTRSSIR